LAAFPRLLAELTTFYAGRKLDRMDSKPAPRYPTLLGVKLPAEVVRALRRQAEADDRTLSAHVRRLLTRAVDTKAATTDERHVY
jgi:hypothetical protein